MRLMIYLRIIQLQRSPKLWGRTEMPLHSRKRSKKHRSAQLARKKAFVRPRTAEEFFSLPEALQEKWIAVTSAITKMRTEHFSRPRAAAEFGLDPRELVQ